MRKLFNDKRVGAYVGIDPTAPSLHVGHLVPLMPLFWMFLNKYMAFTLIGGATAKIGDPTGRLETREIDRSETATNLFKIHYQLKQIWSNVEDLGRRYGWKREWVHRRGIENNSVWWNKQSLLEILQYFGNDLRIGPLLSRETVRRKMTEGDGMSFGEFTYPLMQAWDWWMLNQRLGIQIQIGGSDQFGNIVTGIDVFKIIRKNEPDPHKMMQPGPLSDPVGFTTPLLTDSGGNKFGKTAGNAIWLDPFMTPSYDVYGYFIRQPDSEVEKLLKLFTFMPTAEIETLMKEHMKDPPKRIAHHRLAHEFLWLVQGKEVATHTQNKHFNIHAPSLPAVDNNGIVTLNDSKSMMDLELPRHVLQLPMSRLLVACGLADSASEGQRIANQQGAYIGGSPGQPSKTNKGITPGMVQWTPVKSWLPSDNENFLVEGKYLYIRRGKHNLRIIGLVDDEAWDRDGREYPGQRYKGHFRKLREALREANALVSETDAERDTKKLGSRAQRILEEGAVKRLEHIWDEVEPIARDNELIFPVASKKAQRIEELRGNADPEVIPKNRMSKRGNTLPGGNRVFRKQRVRNRKDPFDEGSWGVRGQR